MSSTLRVGNQGMRFRGYSSDGAVRHLWTFFLLFGHFPHCKLSLLKKQVHSHSQIYFPLGYRHVVYTSRLKIFFHSFLASRVIVICHSFLRYFSISCCLNFESMCIGVCWCFAFHYLKCVLVFIYPHLDFLWFFKLNILVFHQP